jgi:hypothetical protein
MAFDGTPPPSGGGFPTSPKTQEVLDALDEMEGSYNQASSDALLRALYEPALAVAAAVNLVRSGNAGMAPFIGAGGSVLSQALEPLIEHFGDQEAFSRIGVPVVPFSDLPDVPEVETPAVTSEDEDRQSPGETTRPIFSAED